MHRLFIGCGITTHVVEFSDQASAETWYRALAAFLRKPPKTKPHEVLEIEGASAKLTFYLKTLTSVYLAISPPSPQLEQKP